MSGVGRTSSLDTVRPPSPKPQRPPLESRPSTSTFVSYKGGGQPHYAVQGECLPCMAKTRDVYEKMHGEHVSVESKASGR